MLTLPSWCRVSRRPWIGSAALGLALASAGVAERVGPELQVNTYTTGNQMRSVVAIDADGGFVIAWDSDGQDGDDKGIFAQRFSSDGTAIGIELQLNLYTASFQQMAALAIDPDGDFVVTWTSYLQDGSNRGIFARRVSSAGTPLGGELQVNTYTGSSQEAPAVAMETNGDFVVAWDANGDGGGYGIFTRRFSSGGAGLAIEFQVNTYTPGDQIAPDVAMDADGDFVVVWRSPTADASDYGIFVQRFASSGAAVGGEFLANSYTFQPGPFPAFPAVAADDDGDFVVTWTGVGQDGSSGGVFARRFASSGAALGGELQVNAYTSSNQMAPAIAMDADGDFVVAWVSANGQDGASYGIFARRFASSGAAFDELQVNTYTTASQVGPDIASDPGGGFVVTWASAHDGGGFGVFAQRFSAEATIDVDGDGQTGALTDGLLILRYLFGFTGTTLVTGAVDLAGCTRCDAAEIAGYLGTISLQLDIDADGEVLPLTDGLLVLRFLFGFTGTTLVTGAVDLSDCTRCGAPEIALYIGGLT